MVTPPGRGGVSRATVDAFYEAYRSRDPQRIGAMLDDDVEWIVSGPIEVMQVCGSWRGKATVIGRFANHVPQIVAFVSFETERLLVDGDCSAMFGRINVRHRASGRQISHRVAHLVRYRDGKVVSFRCLNDSLDAAEQYIGRPIDLAADAPPLSDDVVKV